MIEYCVSKFCGKNNPIQIFWGQTFLIVNRFSNFFQHILGQTKCRILQKHTLPTVV